MSGAPVIDLEIDQGDDEIINAQVYEPDGTTKVDLTGCILRFYIKVSTFDAVPLILKTSGLDEGIVIQDQVTDLGLAKITISRADTAALDSAVVGRNLLWQIDVEDAAGKHTTVAGGKILINRDLVPVV